MARANKLDPCMFCGNAPCTCNGVKSAKAPKKRAKKEAEPSADSAQPAPITKPVQPDSPSQSADLKAAMKARKKAKPSSAGAPTVASRTSDTGPSTASTVDVKSAMLERKKATPTPTTPVQVQVRKQEVPAYDDDLSVALRALAPILHEDEKRRFKDILINTKTRAASWKRRNRK